MNASDETTPFQADEVHALMDRDETPGTELEFFVEQVRTRERTADLHGRQVAFLNRLHAVEQRTTNAAMRIRLCFGSLPLDTDHGS